MVTLTLRLKLQMEERAEKSLLATMEQYTTSFNVVCALGYVQTRINGGELHKLTYESEREHSDLPSQLVCSARMKATEALLSLRSWEKKEKLARKAHQEKIAKAQREGKKPPKSRKNRTFSCPNSKGQSIRYDARSSTIDLRRGVASLTTIKGRQKVSFSLPSHHKQAVEWEMGSADLVLHRNGKLYLHVVVYAPAKQTVETGEVVGVDVGVSHPAVTSSNLFLGLMIWRAIGDRYFVLRKALQAKGTKSAKRHLKKLSAREHRFREDCDHVLSKRIVQSVREGTILVFEDLTNIRERIQAGKTMRRVLHQWSFARLQVFLCYKAKRAGVFVAFIDPAYTSQCCSRCKHVAKENRKSQSRFECVSCGFRLNADLNAARNIRDQLQASSAIGGGSGRPVNAPIVSSGPREPMRQLSLLDTSGHYSDASLAL